MYQRSVAALLLLTTAACYTEAPLGGPSPAPETRIVASLTDRGTADLAETIGAGAIGVEGVIAVADSGTWSLRLLRVDHRDGRSVAWNREEVSFPSTVFENVTERRFDRARSWLTGGLILGGAFLAASLFHLIGADTNSTPDPVPPQ